LVFASADGTALFVFDGAATRTVSLPASVTVASLLAFTPDGSSLVFLGRDPALGLALFVQHLDLSPATAPLAPGRPGDVADGVVVWADDSGGLGFTHGSGADQATMIVDLRSGQLGLPDILPGRSGPVQWTP